MISIASIKPFLIIGLVFFLRTGDYEQWARPVFFVATGITLSLLALIGWRVHSSVDNSPITVKESDLVPDPSAGNPLASLLKGASGAPAAAIESPSIVTSNKNYDWIKFRAFAPTLLSGPLISFAIHVYLQAVQPLFIQSFINLLNVLTHELGQIYLFGMAAEGNLKRPWGPAPSPFAALQTPAAAEESSEADKNSKKKK